LYTGFVSTFEVRLDQVKLAGLVTLVSKTLADPAAALAFVENVLKSRTRLGAEAAMCIDMDVVMLKLALGDSGSAKTMLEDAKSQLPAIKTTGAVIFSKFYKATAAYRKLVGPANDYYNSALMFLSYTAMDEMSSEEKFVLATDMALASVTGDDIYNFGEVLATPILRTLVGTQNEWLLHLVEAMNSGNVQQFNQVLEGYKTQYFAQPTLAAMHNKVQEKVVLLCLVNVAFERPSHDRLISFSDIASRACIPMDQVGNAPWHFAVYKIVGSS
jgi:26S proteasome regulatory subunit N9